MEEKKGCAVKDFDFPEREAGTGGGGKRTGCLQVSVGGWFCSVSGREHGEESGIRCRRIVHWSRCWAAI